MINLFIKTLNTFPLHQLNIKDTVKKVRNPLMFPGLFGRMFDRRNMDEPKLILKLHGNLHPSLDPAAYWLCVSSTNGNGNIADTSWERDYDETNRHSHLRHACGHFTRIPSFGLKFANYKMLTASTFALDAKNRIQLLAMDIAKGPFVTNDANLLKLSKQVLKNRGYF